MKTLTSPPKLKPPRTRTVVPEGPKIVPKIAGVPGPGEPPPDFLTGQNSLTEWYVYWGLQRIFREPRDPRQPPFFGGYPFWAYQQAEIGGYTRALGSAVVDFVVYQGGEALGIRVQTERFHVYADARKQAYDALQRATLERGGLRVIDLYDTQILGDPSGQKCIVNLKQILNRIELVNPDIAHTAYRASRLKTLR